MSNKIQIRIVEATVNQVSEWRVYVNQELRRAFPTPTAAVAYAEEYMKITQTTYDKKTL